MRGDQLKVRLNEAVTGAIERSLLFQAADGSFPPGKNGPYCDIDTPVRNTAHWLFALSRLLTTSNRASHFQDAADGGARYLMQEARRFSAPLLMCRSTQGADFTNGIIGQAWAIEGLAEYSRASHNSGAMEIAESIYWAHPWSESNSVWHAVDPARGESRVDRTFNHQLWFAAISSSLPGETPLLRAKRFLEAHASKPITYRDGIIFHLSPVADHGATAPGAGGSATVDWLRRRAVVRHKKRLRMKSVGYHSFNLYAYALLKQSLPDHPFWSSSRWRRLLEAVKKSSFLAELRSSSYGWEYNPPGLELAYTFSIFEPDFGQSVSWLRKQHEVTWLGDPLNPFGRRSVDYWTSAARIYEASRMLSFNLRY